MKQETVKKSKKWLKILKKAEFREPYQIILDNSFIKAINRQKLSQRNFNELFRSEPKFFITKCTYENHKNHLVEHDFSGNCEIIKCNHEKPSINCVYEFINEKNSHHYILATNNYYFIKKFKESKFIPTLKINKSQLEISCNNLESKCDNFKNEASKKEIKHLKKMLG